MSARGCARFPEILQNFSERQILWNLCSVGFHAFTMRFPIQTSLSVAPILPIFACSGEKCENFSKTSTPHGEGRGVLLPRVLPRGSSTQEVVSAQGGRCLPSGVYTSPVERILDTHFSFADGNKCLILRKYIEVFY